VLLGFHPGIEHVSRHGQTAERAPLRDGAGGDQASREGFVKFGNLSSASVVFVLGEFRRRRRRIRAVMGC
jgi:predicted naringenin-chalcone synthase